MAIITRDEDNEKILFLHPERKKDGSVRMRKLKSFKNLSSLSRTLSPGAWSRLTTKLGEKYGALQVDWADLREQAFLLINGPLAEKSELDEKALQLRHHLSSAAELLIQLRSSRDGTDWAALRRSGEELQSLIATVAILTEEFRRPKVDRFQLYPYTEEWNHLVADSEAAFELVEQAKAYSGARNLKRARTLFQEARNLDPFDPDIDNSEAIWLWKLGQTEQAIQLFKTAISVARHRLPTDREGPWSWSMHEVRPLVRALSNLAQLHREADRIEQAIELWRVCLVLCPDNPLYCDLELGGCYLRREQPERALPYFHQAKMSMIPTCDPYFNAGLCFLALDKTQEALREFLHGMLANVYVAPRMLSKKIKPRARHWSNVADPEWAESYLEANFGLWSKPARELLRRLYDDPDVAREREDYLAGLEDRRDESLLQGRRFEKIQKRVLLE